MDAFDIALLMANQDASNPLRMRYGTVIVVNDSDRVSVVPDGQAGAVPALRCCYPSLNDRVIMLVNDTEWLAVSVVGGDYHSCPYAVGDILTTTSSVVPSSRWPGTTWSEIKDRSILGAGKRSVGTVGGEENHILSVGEMPSHRHIVAYYGACAGWTGISPNTFWTDTDNGYVRDYNVESTPTGGSSGHNNLHPYYVARLWLRTA